MNTSGATRLTLFRGIGEGFEIKELNITRVVESIRELQTRRAARRLNRIAGGSLKRTAVINVVGLSESLLGDATPHLSGFATTGALCRIKPAFPAVTCTAQATYLTGASPAEHGIVANGWYNRELAEVHFWKQSNRSRSRGKTVGTLCQSRLTLPALNCSGGSTCTPARIGRSLRAHVSRGRPQGVRHLRVALRRSSTDSNGIWVSFLFPAFWGPAAGQGHATGRPDAVSRWIAAVGPLDREKFSPDPQPRLPAPFGL